MESVVRKVHCLAIVSSMALIAAAPLCRAFEMKPASAEVSQLDDEKRARLDVQDLKNRERELEQEDQNANVGQNCGTVSIGNNDGNQHGLNSVVPKSTTVIVTGDVINTANCGR
jgi:hypothetical protein